MTPEDKALIQISNIVKGSDFARIAAINFLKKQKHKNNI